MTEPRRSRSRRRGYAKARDGRSARQTLERDALEAEYQEAIERALWLGGWLYHHDQNVKLPSGAWGIAARGDSGFPDILATHPERGLAIVIELKSQSGSMTPEQRRWLEALEAAGLDVRRFRPADYDGLLDHILGDRQLERRSRAVGRAHG